jgi:hypothetical protein
MFVTKSDTTPFDVCARLGHGQIWAARGICDTCEEYVVQWVRVEVREGKAYTYASFEEPPLERGEAVVLPGNVVKSQFTGHVLRTVPDPAADYPGPYKAVLGRVEPRSACICEGTYHDDCPEHGGLL